MEHIKNGFRFGDEKDDSFITMTVKSIALLIPGMILGHFVDRYIHGLKKKMHLASLYLPMFSYSQL